MPKPHQSQQSSADVSHVAGSDEPSAEQLAELDDQIIALVEALEGIDVHQAAASLNINSIADNNGGRILF